MIRRSGSTSVVSLVAAAVAVAGGVWGLAACTTDYQKGLDDPRFGGPSALLGEKAPEPPVRGGSNVLCVAEGASLVDGGACSVSFSKDVLGIFAEPTCGTATTCHGGSNPANQPRVAPSDPAATWAIFAGFKLSNGKPYINPCSTDKAASTLVCNLAATGTCGSHMPQTGPQISDEDLAKIDTWLACGSPNN